MLFYTNVHLHRGKLLVRGYDNGARIREEHVCKPYLFVPSKEHDSKYKTLDGKPVDRIDFDTPSEARDFVSRYDDVHGFQIYGMTNYTYPFINDYFPKTIEYDESKISVVNMDIEVAADDGFPDIQKADKEVTAICLSKNNNFYVFGCKDYNVTDSRVTYVKCLNERDLLRKFLMAWNAPFLTPDVLTGWNVEFFDVPYLVNRITKVLSAEEARTLSPWRLLDQKKIEILGKENETFVPVGITVLDYLQLYKKFSYTSQESYKLDHIAEYELGEKKLDYSEHGSLLALYKNDYQKFIDYNIRDVELVDKLEAKKKFISQVFAMAYDAKISYSDTLTTVRMWDVIIHNHLMDRNIVVPFVKVSESDETFGGGFVKDVKIGMSNWVVSFDLNSLYPHLIMQYNISPETIMNYIDGISVDSILENGLSDDVRSDLITKNQTVSACGWVFDRSTQGFLGELMQTKYDDRVWWNGEKKLAAKQLKALGDDADPAERKRLSNRVDQCHNMQMAKKIQLNSAYGALGNKYFRWYDLRNAESITMSGQLSIRWMERDMNIYLNDFLGTKGEDYVIASDTDSLYITLEKVVDKMGDQPVDDIVTALDKFCNEYVQKVINKSYEKLAEHMNAYAQKMFMKREAIADRGIWTAKKHYILNMYDLEGERFKEPKLKIMGLEAIKSSTPGICRVAIKEGFKIIMQKTEDDMINFVSDFRNEFFSSDFEKVAFPRGVNNLEKYSDRNTVYRKGTPIHARGALVYNYLVKKHDLVNKYPLVLGSEKIKFCYLRVPNPSGGNVISCPGELPVEFNIAPYIDYDTQFHKSFIEPLDSVLKVIGWNYEKKLTLDRFFE
jgi:DNA polymerase elongation subunit (family B)